MPHSCRILLDGCVAAIDYLVDLSVGSMCLRSIEIQTVPWSEGLLEGVGAVSHINSFKGQDIKIIN